MRINYYRFPDDFSDEHIKYKNGGCFEATDIKLNKNNSNHKYNRHL